MRKEPFAFGSFVHVVKRGARGLSIVEDDNDRNRFLLMLTHFNDEYCSLNWYRDLLNEKLHATFDRPSQWPERKRLVNIIAFCLLDNHFHLLLEEISDGGTARFMKRLGTGMAKRYNEKYNSKGSLFQGAYRARVIAADRYLRYVSAYIQVKNAFEMCEGGYARACSEFDRSYQWAASHSYCSLGDYMGNYTRPIIERGLLSDMFTHTEYRDFCRDIVLGRTEIPEDVLSHFTGFFE